MITSKALSHFQLTTKSSVARLVKKQKKYAAINAVGSALGLAGTGLAVGTQDPLLSAINGGCFMYFFPDLCKNIGLLKIAKHIKSERGVGYSDILERAKQIYKK